jgi:hypothetical protein
MQNTVVKWALLACVEQRQRNERKAIRRAPEVRRDAEIAPRSAKNRLKKLFWILVQNPSSPHSKKSGIERIARRAIRSHNAPHVRRYDRVDQISLREVATDARRDRLAPRASGMALRDERRVLRLTS